MDSLDHDVLSRLYQWLAAGHRAWLCTIVTTWGSSPRPAGSLLACNDAGEVAGSLSGGCVEDELLLAIRRGEVAAAAPQRLVYGVTAADNERLGLPCGGSLEVLVEPCAGDESALALWRELLEALAARRCLRREVDLGSGQWRLLPVSQPGPLGIDDTQLRQDFGPRFQLLLVGAGELSRWVARLALMLDYRVLVCDPREEMVAQWSEPGVTLLRGMPDDVVREHAADSRSIVITLTHDPRIDDMALMEALTRDLFYVGALGSMRTSEKRRERLRALDLDETQLARLHAPVGLDIGSKRPPEIAIAVLAELTALRHRGDHQRA